MLFSTSISLCLFANVTKPKYFTKEVFFSKKDAWLISGGAGGKQIVKNNSSVSSSTFKFNTDPSVTENVPSNTLLHLRNNRNFHREAEIYSVTIRKPPVWSLEVDSHVLLMALGKMHLSSPSFRWLSMATQLSTSTMTCLLPCFFTEVQGFTLL